MKYSAINMRKNYWKLWYAIELGVWEELCLIRMDIAAKTLRKIAYNAAYIATSEHHKALLAQRRAKKK